MLYATRLRDLVLTWGATPEEAASALPGDELVPHADGGATRAIWIDAPAAAVWPWLAQMGPSPRGGVYTYDWIENLLGLDIHSVDVVLPEFQDPQVGDAIALGANTMRIARARARSACSPGTRTTGTGSGRSSCARTTAARGCSAATAIGCRRPPRASGCCRWSPASLVMERRMLLGIRERAERLAAG